jgi:hypothetical protein
MQKLFGMMAALLASAGVAQAQQSSDLNSPPVVPAQFGGLALTDYGQTYPSSVPQSPDMGDYSQVQNQMQGEAPAAAPQSATANPSTCAPSQQLCCPEPWKIHGWIGADFAMWFPMATNLPANMVTTGPGGTGTQLVGTSFAMPLTFGFRIDTGMWTNPEQSRGVQSITNSFFANTGTITVPAGSFINTNGGATSLPLTAGVFTGNSTFTDTDANTVRRLINSENTKVYAIYGPKFASLEEDLTFAYSIGGTNLLDEFHTRNYFIGGQVGAWVVQNFGAFVADLQAKCAIGYSYSNLIVLGRNTLGGNSQVFTNDANIGYFGTSYFSVIPEVDGNLALKVTEHIQVRVGYSFMAYMNTQRVGDQVVAALVPPALAGPHTAPAPPFLASTYIIHGFNVGASWHY